MSRVGGSSRRFTSTAAPTVDMFLHEPVKPKPRFGPILIILGPTLVKPRSNYVGVICFSVICSSMSPLSLTQGSNLFSLF